MGKDDSGDSFGNIVPQDATVLPSAIVGYQTEGLDMSNVETRIAEVPRTTAPRGD